MFLVTLCVTAMATDARAESESTQAPDGAKITKDNYPTQLALRPIVPPKGLLQIDAQYHWQVTLSPITILDRNSHSLWLGASYGLGHQFSLGVSGTFLQQQGGAVEARYALFRNMAARLEAEFTRISESQLSIRNYSTAVGFPSKWTVPGLPLALSGLESMLTISNMRARSNSTLGIVPSDSSILLVSLHPSVRAEYSFEFLTMTAGVSGNMWQYRNAVRDVQWYGWNKGAAVFATLTSTLPRFDLSLSLAEIFLFEVDIQKATQATLTASFRLGL